ncbi:DUF4847 family protein [Bacteroides sp. 224]|uniref:DUF4847 family protein n=1 Tax=Bacteroides sp. 224 TaxID=2302936 RepID=UPI0013D5D408|nr:DUF4847 family protein [Bacteroides sp. 224]
MNKISAHHSKFIILLLSLALPFLGSCDDEDDVAGIFTGKTWKMTGIYEKGSVKDPYKGYWSNEASFNASMKLLEEPGNFNIIFEGSVSDKTIKGLFTGRATNTNLSGNWAANGGNNSFFATPKETTDNDALGNAFIEGLRNAHKYEGDYDNLRIYFTIGSSERFILFHVK